MRAIQYEAYGDRSVMHLAEANVPTPKADQVRVRVHAASINPVDGKIRRGELKFLAGGHFPKRPGLDFEGTVDAVGQDVQGFMVGERVFGGSHAMSEGSLAEFVIASAGALAHSPRSLTSVESAAVPVVGIAALQSLRDIAHVKRGDRVLVNGCTGGVGLFALQLAHRSGAHVTGVCGTDGVAQARAYGADDVVDYREARPTADHGRYATILELRRSA